MKGMDKIYVQCEVCKGRGFVEYLDQGQTTTHINTLTCGKCEGAGVVETKFSLEIPWYDTSFTYDGR